MRNRTRSLCVLLAAACLNTAANADFLATPTPPDADKAGAPGDNSCWMATAANMLAGAGYGDGDTLQARTNDIYGDMITQYGIANGGWTDTALTWWLSSANNTWTENPYRTVRVYGNKSPKNPWANASGRTYIAQQLREGNLVGLSISWPSSTAVGRGGHAITAWGDDGTAGSTAGITQVKVTDSDRDTGGNVQTYTYDAYNNPNPGGPGGNEGNGWYFNFTSGGDNAYIKHIAVLEPVSLTIPFLGEIDFTKRVKGSYQIKQKSIFQATDLHYRADSSKTIFNYNTRINREGGTATVTENKSGKWIDNIDVDWNLAGNPVPTNSTVTITTEFTVPNGSGGGVTYSNVHYTYPNIIDILPSFGWDLLTVPVRPTHDTPTNATGGYFVGAFDIWGSPNDPEPVGSYRFLSQYDYTENPEEFALELFPEGDLPLYLSNLRMGHSYGDLFDDELWDFNDWLTRIDNLDPFTSGRQISFDWSQFGLLNYPPAEDFPYVPEPAAMTLLAMCALTLARRRRV